MEVCKVCNREFKSIQSLAKHVKRMHSMTSEEYYLKYLGEQGICSCGNKTKYRNMVVGYSSHCSAKCSYHDPEVTKKREGTTYDKYGVKKVGNSTEVREKIKSTLKEKYGVEHTFQSKEIQDKSKQTLLNKYGVDNSALIPEVRDKIRKTNLEKYGTEHAMENKDIQKKAQDTNLKKYGVKFVAQLPEVQKKIKDTNIKKYGVPVTTQSPDILAKRDKTNIERYGYSTPLKNHDVQLKSKKTCYEKYGVHHTGASKEAHKNRKKTNLGKYGFESTFQVPEIKSKIKNTLLNSYGVDNSMKSSVIKGRVSDTNIKRYGVPTYLMTEIAKKKRHEKRLRVMLNKYKDQLDIYNCELIDTYSTDELKVKYKCNSCNETHIESWQFFVVCRLNMKVTPCPTCLSKKPIQSHQETQLSDYIKTLCDDVIVGNRNIIKPRELDIYIPSMKLAIEYNGLYFHSEMYKPSDYHVEKTDQCNVKGIQLVHVYEDDWLYKKDIVKSRIINLLGKSERIYARKCVIKEVKSKEANKFLDDNHIQGKCRSKFKYGLFYNDELVSLMTFGKSRFANEFELIRFCNKLNTTVIGGASKLFKHFTNTHNDIKRIISYADRSWSVGGLYEKLGFEFDSITSPGYSYINGNIRENRMKYQKHKLVDEGYDKNMTEHEIMLSRKMYRIYDSGNLKYIWER